MGKYGVSKIGLFVVVLALFASARCYSSDPETVIAGLPILGAMVSPAPPVPAAYVNTIGAPAAQAFPAGDLAKWFSTPDSGDAYSVEAWAAIEQFVAHSTTAADWAAACKQAGESAGAERTANPRLGALGCSDDGTVTQYQRFAANLLSAQVHTALFIKGAPGSSTAAIQSRQSEIRLACSVEVVSRNSGPGTALGQACAKGLDASYMAGDMAATFAALGEAYELVAAEIARLDPSIDAEPGYFAAKIP